MNFKDRGTWKLIASAMYAIGVWTMIGSFVFSSRLAGIASDLEEPSGPNKVVYQTAYTKTVIIYKKDFVPYTTRISNYFKSSSSQDK